MTMPVFINKYQKHVAAKRLQTIYSQLAQAIQRAEYENGAKMSVWVPFGWDSGPGLAKALAPYLKATYYDPSGTTVSESFCYRGGTIKPYKDGLGRVLPENTSSFINPSCTASISLPSGACVGFNGIAWCPDSMGTIPVDVDGPYSGPNQYGKDVFVFNYFASSGYWGLYLGNNNPKDQEFYTCLKSTNNLYNVRSCTKAIAANNWTIPDNFKGW